LQEAQLNKIAESLDQLIKLDVPARGVIGALYDAARRKAGQPLTLAAVNVLKKAIKPGDKVIIATGWIDQPVVAPGYGESDGPPGAIALARALRIALKAAPIIVTDSCLVDGLKKVARAGGFQCVEPDELQHSIDRNKLITISVLPFPVDDSEARCCASEMLATLKPAACIALERGGMNKVGIIHNMLGQDTGLSQAKIDYIFQLAGKQGITTVGIGDGGNEIGMGNILEAITKEIPYGDKCNCGCGDGILAATPVDVLVTASISNWGGYALAALLGIMTGEVTAINDPVLEKRVLEATANAGFHDPLSGGVFPGADGCEATVHLAMVTLIKETVLQGAARYC
jgi:hypothetical protein